MNKIQHFILWLRKYIVTLFFPRVFVKEGFRRDWMTWTQYKRMTDGLTKTLPQTNE